VWVTAVTADCPARSRGRYTGCSAVGDMEDNWWLVSPAPLEERKMIYVVAISLLHYANSQLASILQVIGVWNCRPGAQLIEYRLLWVFTCWFPGS